MVTFELGLLWFVYRSGRMMYDDEDLCFLLQFSLQFGQFSVFENLDSPQKAQPLYKYACLFSARSQNRIQQEVIGDD